MPYTLKQSIDFIYKNYLLRNESDPIQDRLIIFEEETIEREWGWVFFYNSELFYRVRISPLVGIGPLFFNRHTGEIRQFSTGVDSTENLILDYEWEMLDREPNCLCLSAPNDRKETILIFKHLFRLPLAQARDLVKEANAPFFMGKRSHLEWLEDKMANVGVRCHIELLGDRPACELFVLPRALTLRDDATPADAYPVDPPDDSQYLIKWAETPAEAQKRNGIGN